jgi:hypothetical protein
MRPFVRSSAKTFAQYHTLSDNPQHIPSLRQERLRPIGLTHIPSDLRTICRTGPRHRLRPSLSPDLHTVNPSALRLYCHRFSPTDSPSHHQSRRLAFRRSTEQAFHNPSRRSPHHAAQRSSCQPDRRSALRSALRTGKRSFARMIIPRFLHQDHRHCDQSIALTPSRAFLPSTAQVTRQALPPPHSTTVLPSSVPIYRPPIVRAFAPPRPRHFIRTDGLAHSPFTRMSCLRTTLPTICRYDRLSRVISVRPSFRKAIAT